MSKFGEYLENNQIDPRRILVASKKLEALRPEDRAIKLLKRKARTEEKPDKEAPTEKPRSGRPVTRPALDVALRGDKLSTAAKKRILRAVNAVLKQKKKGEVALDDLF
jgi:hypothetical protein